METIVASGTKLNLDYAIDEMVDEYEQEEIIDYFKGCQTSSLQVAQEELADSNFNWEQLKLMRIKFLCEYGNWFDNFWFEIADFWPNTLIFAPQLTIINW